MKESDVKRLETAVRNLKTVEKSLMKVYEHTYNSMESMPCIYACKDCSDVTSQVSMYVGEMVAKVRAAKVYVEDFTCIFIKELKIE